MYGLDTSNYELRSRMTALDTCSEQAEAYSLQKRYKNVMDREVSRGNETDWATITTNVISHGDTNFDGLISTDEFTESLFYQYDIDPTESDRQWVKDNIDNYCS